MKQGPVIRCDLPPHVQTNTRRYPRTVMEAFPQGFAGSIQGPYHSKAARRLTKIGDAILWAAGVGMLVAIVYAPAWWPL